MLPSLCPTRTHGTHARTAEEKEPRVWGQELMHVTFNAPNSAPSPTCTGSTPGCGRVCWADAQSFPSAPALVDVICQKKGCGRGHGKRSAHHAPGAREKRKRAPFVTVRAHPRDNICRKRQASHATVLCLFPPKPPICALPCGSVPRRGRIPSHHHALSYPQSPSRFTTRM